MSVRRTTLLATVTLVGVVVAGAVVASTTTTEAIRAVQAVRRAVSLPVAVHSVELAPSDPAYARVEIEGFQAGGVSVGVAFAILHRTSRGAWTLVTLGTAELGCKVPDTRVRAELDIACGDGSGAATPSGQG